MPNLVKWDLSNRSIYLYGSNVDQSADIFDRGSTILGNESTGEYLLVEFWNDGEKAAYGYIDDTLHLRFRPFPAELSPSPGIALWVLGSDLIDREKKKKSLGQSGNILWVNEYNYAYLRDLWANEFMEKAEAALLSGDYRDAVKFAEQGYVIRKHFGENDIAIYLTALRKNNDKTEKDLYESMRRSVNPVLLDLALAGWGKRV